jgi:hypothetical protein
MLVIKSTDSQHRSLKLFQLPDQNRPLLLHAVQLDYDRDLERGNRFDQDPIGRRPEKTQPCRSRWRRQLLETVMTSAQTLPELASKIFYFSLAASAFVFISMLLMTSLHP